jgi:hypothetical protein
MLRGPLGTFERRFRCNMKKNKLTIDYPIDFELAGIVCREKEYKLAWNLNQLPKLHLVKSKDLKIEFSDNKSVSVSVMSMETEYLGIYLLKNRLSASSSSAQQYLLSELQQFDYLMKITSQIEPSLFLELLPEMKKIDIIDFCVKVDLEKVKMRENLLF